ncbi:MAG TPA: sigma-70 family RNA polymerase sigma factor [Trebonia sp.]|nr:sigma-70 family RNA polymerase sigma factor [Trebonia sp.]
MDYSDTHADTPPRPGLRPPADEGVTALYAEHAVGLIRLGFVMLGDRGAAEDVVQDAFLGLYRNWGRLNDPANALTYLRTSVLNGCRAALRARARRDRRDRAAAAGDGWLQFDSAEAAVLLSEEHREVLAAVRKLAPRQREALMLRYYLGLSPDETARVMGVSTGTVKSAVSRAIAVVGRALKEES